MNLKSGSLGVAMVLMAGLAGEAKAQKYPDMTGRFGAGLQLTLPDVTVGPTGEYWINRNIGLQGTAAIVGDYESFSLRGLWMFDKAFPLFGHAARPYAGVGVITIREEARGIDLDGTGIEVFGGVQQQMFFTKVPNLYWAAEAGYSAVKVEGDVTFFGITQTIEGDAGGFGLASKVIYYFGKM